MKTLYLDCQYGISGDMTLASLIDLGADIDYIITNLRRLPVDPFTMTVKTVDKKGIASKQLVLTIDSHHDEHDHAPHQHEHSHAYTHHHEHTHAHYHEHEHEHHHHEHKHTHHHEHGHHHHHHDHGAADHQHRRASEILDMIKASDLPVRVKERSSAIFQEIAIAEGKIHGIDPREVHFHEVGAMDSIIDIIGVCLALEDLEIDRVVASPVPTGYGQIQIAHGLYPIPAPATAELLKGIPLKALQAEGELTTPTGAGILRALVKEYGPMPALTIEQIGYGAGMKNFAHPNVLRTILFQATESELLQENIIILECQLDDMAGEMFGYVMDILLEAGALDVFYTAVVMKKNRPGILMTVLSKPETASKLEHVLLQETTTFGVRRSEWTRRILERKWETVRTIYGDVAVKIGYVGDVVYQVSPEYDVVKKAAKENGVSFKDVYFAAKSQFLQEGKSNK